MKNKKFLFVLLCGVLLFTLTGCGNKKVATMVDFENAVKDAGLNLLETDSDDIDESLKDVGTAYSTDLDVMAMFYIYDSVGSAKTDYEDSIESIETSSNTTISMGNYNTFEGKLKDESLASYEYVYISRVDDTILMIISSEDKKDDAKAIAKKLGY